MTARRSCLPPDVAAAAERAHADVAHSLAQELLEEGFVGTRGVAAVIQGRMQAVLATVYERGWADRSRCLTEHAEGPN